MHCALGHNVTCARKQISEFPLFANMRSIPFGITNARWRSATGNRPSPPAVGPEASAASVTRIIVMACATPVWDDLGAPFVTRTPKKRKTPTGFHEDVW